MLWHVCFSQITIAATNHYFQYIFLIDFSVYKQMEKKCPSQVPRLLQIACFVQPTVQKTKDDLLQ